MWAFILFFAFVLVMITILSVWIGGPDNDKWPDEWGPKPEDQLVTQEWLSRQQAESKARLYQHDEHGLVHSDDLAP